MNPERAAPGELAVLLNRPDVVPAQAGRAVLLVIGSVLTASATDAVMFIVGHVIQGLCTSLLLIAAVPPLAIGYPANKLRDTAVIMNMCIFGAVALGPLVEHLASTAGTLF